MTENLMIAPARPEDARELAALYAADMEHLGIAHSSDALLPMVDATLNTETSHMRTWVARCADGRIAGVILANPFWSLKVAGKALWIEELYVRPEHRLRGIGRRLVEHLLDWAEDNQFLGVELEAYRMNTGASILYRELGFQRLARERYCYHFRDES